MLRNGTPIDFRVLCADSEGRILARNRKNIIAQLKSEQARLDAQLARGDAGAGDTIQEIQLLRKALLNCNELIVRLYNEMLSKNSVGGHDHDNKTAQIP